MEEIKTAKSDIGTTVMRKLEDVDSTLRSLSAALTIMADGAYQQARDGLLSDVFFHVLQTVQSARADLDEATGAIMQMRKTA